MFQSDLVIQWYISTFKLSFCITKTLFKSEITENQNRLLTFAVLSWSQHVLSGMDCVSETYPIKRFRWRDNHISRGIRILTVFWLFSASLSQQTMKACLLPKCSASRLPNPRPAPVTCKHMTCRVCEFHSAPMRYQEPNPARLSRHLVG
jgi:hypothetical protein